MLPQDVITDNLVKQKLFGSAVTVIPTTEVVFVSKDGVASKAALDREELWRTQTPHSYKFDELWDVHNRAISDGITNMAASCSLMQKYGYTTYFSKGSEKNIKITTVEDIEIFKALLKTILYFLCISIMLLLTMWFPFIMGTILILLIAVVVFIPFYNQD